MIHENREQFDYDKYMKEKYYHVETKFGIKVEIIPRLLRNNKLPVIGIIKGYHSDTVITFRKNGTFYSEAPHGTSSFDLYMYPFTNEELGEIYADMVADDAIMIAKDQIIE